ncbi:hypothetical protein [Fibrivirga algicola]|uniref:Lipoprotein n=1 Tax=Fibrivirga algicola TaxID=2950420 RepID=A0ABX0QL08_9BACT|nr:hypothetical protein [Fibrivirga algicola]NID13119.1 hypothetical protein [Fibrivirga algicola]
MRFLYLFLFIVYVSSTSCQTTSPTDQDALARQGPDSVRWVKYSLADIKTDTTLFSKPEEVGELADRRLSESSGLAQSQTNPNYLWTHQDSGNSNELQLLDKQGHVVGRYTLAGITNRDWEDIAVGPGPLPGRSYVYVAEIGDNRLKHATKTIYRFLEPAIISSKFPITETVTAIDVIDLQLPDGPRNAEAILLDPLTLDLYIVSKEQFAELYKASYPQSLTSTTPLQRVLITPFRSITAASVSPDGTEMLIRSYKQLFYFSRQVGESIEAAMRKPPRLISLAQEPQGEAIGWASAGQGKKPYGYFTVSERTLFFIAEPMFVCYRR